MTTDNFCFYLQNRLIETSQTGGQQYSDTCPVSMPCHDTQQCHSVKWTFSYTKCHYAKCRCIVQFDLNEADTIKFGSVLTICQIFSALN